MFSAEFFTNKNIIEPLLNHYRDYSYVKFVMSLPFEDGWELYIQGIKRTNDLIEEKQRELLWNLWLVEIQNGLKDDFQTFYNSRIKLQSNKKENNENKDKLENELIEKYKNVDIKRIKRRILE